MTLAITKLKEAGKFERVSHPLPPPGIISSSSAHSGDFESRKKVMKQIMEALIDESTQVIGICGMGGLGKTVMVKQIAKQAKEGKLFSEVPMAVVSENPDVKKIQKDLADMLGLKLEDGSELHRAGLLWDRIRKAKSILIILDDVWKRLDLEAVGIPLATDHAGCKILLTSRNQVVCDQMDVQKTFPLSALSPEEAWVLFREKAGEVVDSSDLNGIARDVARECGGLPLAIVTVARALKSRNKDVWIDAALQLKKSALADVGGLHSDVFPKIELSFNFLESKVAKSCFLLCCMFPEDWNIGVEDLVRYGIGLRLFEGVDTIEEARGRVRTAVSTLTASFLLLDGDSENEVCVKMHDVVRDVAISIARKDEQNRLMVKAGIGLRNWRDTEIETYSGISLMSNDIGELPSGLECPKLQTLLLSRNSEWLQIPNDFFQGMKDLKVLDMSYMAFFSPPFNCESLQFLTVLRTLYLDDINVADLSIIGSLKTLEILIILSPYIDEIPQDIGGLTHLRLFDLRGYLGLSKIAQGVSTRLGKLEELYAGFTSEFWRDGRNGNASIAELQSLGSRLTCLSLWTPIDANQLPENLHFPHLTRFSITIGRNGRSWHPPEYRRSLSIKGDLRIPLIGWIMELFEKTEFLELLHCETVKYAINKKCGRPQNLSTFRAFSCRSLVHVFEWEEAAVEGGDIELLSKLKHLYLEDLPKLMHIWKVPHHQLISLCNLKTFNLSGCPKLRSVFSADLVQGLVHLELLRIKHCDDLEEVFGVHEEEETEAAVRKKDPSSSGAPYLRNLTCLEIRGCHRLTSILSPSIAKRLVQLREMRVGFCQAMEEIIKGEKEQAAAAAACAENIVFPCVAYIYLDNMDRLNCFCKGHRAIEWPSLERLRITDCLKMETFGYGVQLTPKLKGVEVDDGREILINGELNATVQQIFKDEASRSIPPCPSPCISPPDSPGAS